MGAIKAYVRGGRIVVEERVDLPEGAEVLVALVERGASELHAADASTGTADAGGLDERDLWEGLRSLW